MWGYQGDKTLAYYLKRRDCARALADDLGVDEAAAVPTAMKQIFECLSVGGWVDAAGRVGVGLVGQGRPAGLAASGIGAFGGWHCGVPWRSVCQCGV